MRPFHLPLCLGFSLLAQSQEPEPSQLILPIRVDLGPAFDAAERTVPKIPPGVETWTPVPGSSTTVFRFNLYRDHLMPSLKQNQLKVRTLVHYWMEVGIKAGPIVKSVGRCGLGNEGFRRAMLGVQAQLEVTPQWTLNLKAEPLEPELPDRCTLTFLEYDITPKVMAGMKDAMVKATQAMVELARSEALLKPKVQLAWDQLQQPVEITPGVFLRFQPERIRLAPFQAERNSMVLLIEIQARPNLVFGSGEPGPKQPLPPLENLSTPPTPGFRIRVDSELPFTEANAQLARQLVGKRFDTDKGSFEILGCGMRAKGDRVALDLDLKGKVNGRLSLVGRPVFDEVAGTLQLMDLDYTLEAKSWITQFGEWVFRSTLKKVLQEQSNFLMGRQFRDMKEQVAKGLNRELLPGLKMTGSLQSLRLAQPLIANDRIKVEAFLEGQVALDATGLIPR